MDETESASLHCVRCGVVLSAIPSRGTLCQHYECGGCGNIYVDEGNRIVPCTRPHYHVGKTEIRWPGE